MRMVLLGLLAALFVSGCAQSDGASNDDHEQNRYGGFYGGVNAGM